MSLGLLLTEPRTRITLEEAKAGRQSTLLNRPNNANDRRSLGYVLARCYDYHLILRSNTHLCSVQLHPAAHRLTKQDPSLLRVQTFAPWSCFFSVTLRVGTTKILSDRLECYARRRDAYCERNWVDEKGLSNTSVKSVLEISPRVYHSRRIDPAPRLIEFDDSCDFPCTFWTT
ncbi:hypothetical protein BC628DRAFT_992058 [Trametes gibbosa]|nr:hypothetical protein BC628DRAFT_992058 [Trametes gibbosa]